jgi:RpiB/LacA/LacB family sugar-phosphate isomerase
MLIALACDHAGYPLKKLLHDWLVKNGHQVLNLGVDTDAVPADYPDYACAAGQAVAAGKAERGIVVCGSGVGATVAANKVRGVRAGMCHDTFSAHQGVEDDDVNVLCLGGRVIGSELAYEIVRVWLNAKFTGAERHLRRKNKVLAIESANSKEA